MTVIAMPSELPLTDRKNVLITGVGALNVIMALKGLPLDLPILNVGYAGSNHIPVGTCCRIGKVRAYHPIADFEDREYELDGDVPCYTAGDFVTHTDIVEDCVFDMELAYILALGFTNVTAIKIVSDNLNLREFEKNV